MHINHIGISGGKDSTALLLWAVHESGYPLDSIVASFCDTGNEAPETYDYIAMLSDRVHPIRTIKPPLDFWELAAKKSRFPSVKARFCTQALKIFPTQDYIKSLLLEGHTVLLHSGVRADESNERAKLAEREWDEYYATEVYRPLLRWTLADVWACLARYGIPRNPLYDLGARRVGCFPCIMSNKAEMRMIGKQFPERIEFLAAKEREINSSFFRADTTPEAFRRWSVTNKSGETWQVPSVRDVVDWANTSRGGRQYEMDLDEGALCESNLGVCE